MILYWIVSCLEFLFCLFIVIKFVVFNSKWDLDLLFMLFDYY